MPIYTVYLWCQCPWISNIMLILLIPTFWFLYSCSTDKGCLLVEDDALQLPSWCNATDPSVPFCQILIEYQMELPGYNTLTPYMPTWMKPVQLCLQLTPGLIIADSIRHTCTYELVNLSLTVVHNNCCNAWLHYIGHWHCLSELNNKIHVISQFDIWQ
jgi:hypothetical protein